MKNVIDELKGVSAQYQKDMESINEEEQAREEYNDQCMKDTQFPKFDDVGKKREDKVKSTRIQFKTDEKNYDMLKGFDYDYKLEMKREASKSNGDFEDYLSPADLTLLKLKHSSLFKSNVDVSLFTQFIRRDPEAKNWVSRDIFKKLDLSDGKRTGYYSSMIDEEKSGWMTELNEQYFYEPNADTLLVACTLFAIDTDERFRGFRPRYEYDILEIKKYFKNIETNFDDSIKGICDAILLDKVSGYKAPIYCEFLYDFIVERNNSLQSSIVKHSGKLKECLEKILEYNSIKTNEVSLKEIVEAHKYL